MIVLRTIATLAAAGFSAGIAVSGARAAESVYTDLDLDACTMLDFHEESGSASFECAGLPDYPVFASEGDLRFDVDFGVPNERWESFSPFNAINDVVEWRVTDGEPHAAILRYLIDTGVTGGPEDKGEVLVVSRVGREGSPGCVVALVDATIEQANGVARGAAAMAPLFACRSQAPVAIGPEGSFAFSFSGMTPEGQ